MKPIVLFVCLALPCLMAFVKTSSPTISMKGMSSDSTLLSHLSSKQKDKLLKLKAHKIFVKYNESTGRFAQTSNPKMNSSMYVGYRCGEIDSACFSSHILLDVRGMYVKDDTGLGFHTKNGQVYAFSSGEVRDHPEKFLRTVDRLIDQLGRLHISI